MSDDRANEIVVVGRRPDSRSSANADLVVSVSIDTDGTFDTSDVLPAILRTLLINQSDFDVDETFFPKQKEIIVKAIIGLASLSQYREHFLSLLTKKADINITSVQFLGDAQGETQGLSNGTVSAGSTINILIRVTAQGGGPLLNRAFAVAIVHELLHALGVPSISQMLDADGSTLDSEVTDQIFSGYDFAAAVAAVSDLQTVIRLAAGSSVLSGTSGGEVLAGSDQNDVIASGGGADTVFSGGGDDEISVVLDGQVKVILDDGGVDTLRLPADVDPTAISTRWTANGSEGVVVVGGVDQVAIRSPSSVNAIERIAIGGAIYQLSSFPSEIEGVIEGVELNVDHYGAFSGGFIASARTQEMPADTRFRITGVTLAHSDAPWSIDSVSGILTGNFWRPDGLSTALTQIGVIATSSQGATGLMVTVRWQPSSGGGPDF